MVREYMYVSDGKNIVTNCLHVTTSMSKKGMILLKNYLELELPCLKGKVKKGILEPLLGDGIVSLCSLDFRFCCLRQGSFFSRPLPGDHASPLCPSRMGPLPSSGLATAVV